MSSAHSSAANLARVVGRVAGAVPGWYMVLVEPWARRDTRTVTSTSAAGAVMELRLDQFVERKHWFHAYERREIAFVYDVVDTGDIVVDVGANVGVLTMEAAAAAGSSGLVVAVEPVPANVERLRRNASLNPAANVEVVACAVGDADGTLQLGITDQQASIGNAGSYSAAATGSAVEVPLQTLDRIVDERCGAGAHVRLLKIDVEGMEANVVRGAAGLLGAHRIDLLMFEQNAQLAAEDPVALLSAAGYQVAALGIGRRLRPLKPSSTRHATAEVRAGVLASMWAWLRGDARLTTLVASAPGVTLRAGRR